MEAVEEVEAEEEPEAAGQEAAAAAEEEEEAEEVAAEAGVRLAGRQRRLATPGARLELSEQEGTVALGFWVASHNQSYQHLSFQRS